MEKRRNTLSTASVGALFAIITCSSTPTAQGLLPIASQETAAVSRRIVRLSPTARKKECAVPVILSSKQKSDNEQNNTLVGNLQKQGVKAGGYFLEGLWRGVTLPFPVLRRIVLQPSSGDRKMGIGLTFREGLSALVAYLLIGALTYSCVLEKWSLIDALYFSSVTFSVRRHSWVHVVLVMMRIKWRYISHNLLCFIFRPVPPPLLYELARRSGTVIFVLRHPLPNSLHASLGWEELRAWEQRSLESEEPLSKLK